MSSTTPQANRPLSPFMIGPYYRAQLTSMLSIVHRITGVGLSLGTILLAGWLVAIASGPGVYDVFEVHLTAWYGQSLLMAWSWSLLFHLCNGVRHLFWDLGYGFEMKTVYRSGYAVLTISLLLTAAVWIFVYAF